MNLHDVVRAMGMAAPLFFFIALIVIGYAVSAHADHPAEHNYTYYEDHHTYEQGTGRGYTMYMGESRIWDSTTESWHAAVIDVVDGNIRMRTGDATITMRDCTYEMRDGSGAWIYTDLIYPERLAGAALGELTCSMSYGAYAKHQYWVNATWYDGHDAILEYRYSMHPERSNGIDTLMVLHNPHDLPISYAIHMEQHIPWDGEAHETMTHTVPKNGTLPEYLPESLTYDHMEAVQYIDGWSTKANGTVHTVQWSLGRLPSLAPDHTMTIDPRLTLTTTSLYRSTATGWNSNFQDRTIGSTTTWISDWVYYNRVSINERAVLRWSLELPDIPPQYTTGYVKATAQMRDRDFTSTRFGYALPRVTAVLWDDEDSVRTLPAARSLYIWDDRIQGSWSRSDGVQQLGTGNRNGVWEGHQYSAYGVHSPPETCGPPYAYAYNNPMRERPQVMLESWQSSVTGGGTDCSDIETSAGDLLRTCSFVMPLKGFHTTDNGLHCAYDFTPGINSTWGHLTLFYGAGGMGDTLCVYNCQLEGGDYSTQTEADRASRGWGQGGGSRNTGYNQGGSLEIDTSALSVTLWVDENEPTGSYGFKTEPDFVRITTRPDVSHTRDRTSAHLTWDAVPGAKWYTVTWQDEDRVISGPHVTGILNSTHTATHYTMTNLDPDESYTVAVRAGNSVQSTAGSINILAHEARSQIVNLRAIPVDQNTVKLQWQDGGYEPGTSYKVYQNGTHIFDTGALEITIRDLDRWAGYSFRVDGFTQRLITFPGPTITYNFADANRVPPPILRATYYGGENVFSVTPGPGWPSGDSEMGHVNSNATYRIDRYDTGAGIWKTIATQASACTTQGVLGQLAGSGSEESAYCPHNRDVVTQIRTDFGVPCEEHTYRAVIYNNWFTSEFAELSYTPVTGMPPEVSDVQITFDEPNNQYRIQWENDGTSCAHDNTIRIYWDDDDMLTGSDRAGQRPTTITYDGAPPHNAAHTIRNDPSRPFPLEAEFVWWWLYVSSDRFDMDTVLGPYQARNFWITDHTAGRLDLRFEFGENRSNTPPTYVSIADPVKTDEYIQVTATVHGLENLPDTAATGAADHVTVCRAFLTNGDPYVMQSNAQSVGRSLGLNGQYGDRYVQLGGTYYVQPTSSSPELVFTDGWTMQMVTVMLTPGLPNRANPATILVPMGASFDPVSLVNVPTIPAQTVWRWPASPDIVSVECGLVGHVAPAVPRSLNGLPTTPEWDVRINVLDFRGQLRSAPTLHILSDFDGIRTDPPVSGASQSVAEQTYNAYRIISDAKVRLSPGVTGEQIPLFDIFFLLFGTDVFGAVQGGQGAEDVANLGGLSITMIFVTVVVMIGFKGSRPIIGVVMAGIVVWVCQYVNLIDSTTLAVTWGMLTLLGIAAFVRERPGR